MLNSHSHMKSNTVCIDSYSYAAALEDYFKTQYGKEFDYTIHDCELADKFFGLAQVGSSLLDRYLSFDVVDKQKYLLAKISYGLIDFPYVQEEE